jgi:hypothetical protein
MDEDPDKMNAIIEGCKLIKKMEPSKFIEIYEMYNKELTWFIAIGAGTLLLILSNFDKFILADGSMPNKLLYMDSIFSVGISTLDLVILKALFFWNENTILRSAVKLNNVMEDMQENLRDLGNVQSLKSIPPSKLSSLFDTLEKIKKEPNSLYEKSFKLADIYFSKGNIILVVIFYLLGIACFSAYIIIFMRDYV